MKRRLQDMNLDGKRVVLRCDFNVPMKDGEILDDSKIRTSIPTIKYLLDRGCSIVILSHFGKVKTESDKVKNSLEPVALVLKEMLGINVIFSKQNRANLLEEKCMTLKPGDILVLENTRFQDIPDNLESGCDMQLASYWASLGDVFVMDAFGSTHRKHASTYGIAKFIPSCIGLLVEKEINMLDDNVFNAEKPFTIIMGGAKIDDKLLLIEKLLPKCDNMLFTGGIANTFLKALDINVGASLCSTNPEILDKVKDMLVNYRNKIVLPFDVIVGRKYDESYVEQKNSNEVEDDDVISDIGNKTIENYASIIRKSKTVFLNGTAGIYEDKRFSNGTLELLSVLANSNCKKIAGGGDACSAVRKFKFEDNFDYLSTGGGATLEYLVSGNLVACESIPDLEDTL